MQVDVWRYSIEVKGQSPVLGKCLLSTAIGKKAPTVIGEGAAVIHVRIRESSVDIDAGILGSVPVDVSIQVDTLTAPDVLVGSVEHVLSCRVLQTWNLRVGHHPHHVLDAVIGKAIAQGKVDIELRCEIAVTEVERMTFLTLKMRITLIDIGGRRVVEVRIEIPDARTVDAHVVAYAQVRCLRQFIANAGRGHKIVEVLREVITTPQFVFHILQGMLIAQT